MYDLDFNTAINMLIEGKGFVRGENFRDGYYLDIKPNGDIVLVYGNSYPRSEELFVLTKGAFQQKYRVFSCATSNELKH